MNSKSIDDITLNCLINPSQLARLNNARVKYIEKTLHEKIEEDTQLKDDIINLFGNILNGNIPSNLPLHITDKHTELVKKMVYYLETNKEENTNKESVNENNVNDDDDIYDENDTDDCDYKSDTDDDECNYDNE